MARVAPMPRRYEDFQPSSEWVRDLKSDTLVVNLPGFKKEQIKVQIDNHGNLMVSGEQPIEGDRWRRFRNNYRMPEKCNKTEIRAKLEKEHLYVTLPKLNTQAEAVEPKEKPLPQSEQPAASHKAMPEPQPSAHQADTSQKNSTEISTRPDIATGMQENGKRKSSEEQSETADADKDRIDLPKESQKPKRRRRSSERMSEKHKKAKHRQVMLNVAMAVVVFVGLAVYIIYKVRSSTEPESILVPSDSIPN